MATIAPGYTWSTGQEVNGPNLTTLVAGAKIRGIARSEIDAESKVWFTGSPSSPQVGDHRYDSADSYIKVYDGTLWQPVGRGIIASNAMATYMPKGMLVRLQGGLTPTVTPTATIGDQRAFGVVLATMSGSGSGIIQCAGYAQILGTTTGSQSGFREVGDRMTSAGVTGFSTGTNNVYSGSDPTEKLKAFGFFLQTISMNALATCFLQR